LARIGLAGKQGYIDKTGRLLGKQMFDATAERFSEGLAVVKRERRRVR
jgi:hypothetical protein